MRKILSLLLATLFSSFVIANNVIISNVSVNGNNITFTLSWENSWNSTNNTDPNYPNNWDAVWIFVKYQDASNLWKHVVLSATSANHSVTGAGGVLQVNAVTDGMGVFVRRSVPGGGNITNAAVTLAMTGLPAGILNFKVFGVEMVYCPTGAFTLGDGNNTGFIPQTIGATTQANGLVINALYPGSPPLLSTFPMGYYGFYIMKYEASHQQYADFLNTLTYDQQINRTQTPPNSPAGTRAIEYLNNNISYGTTRIIEIISPGQNNTIPAVYGCDFTNDNNFNSNDDGQNIALENISTNDYLAYLDWAAIRPMTEMEYEKACRGTKPAVLYEHAWGTTDINCYERVRIITPPFTTSVLDNPGQATESVQGSAVNGRCFCGMGVTLDYPGDGTARNGIFATSSTGRLASGAGFYGAMELSGSAWELCINPDNDYLKITNLGVGAVGSSPFMGIHGDGLLNANGESNVSNWPFPHYYSTLYYGVGRRGGSWQYTVNWVSFRPLGNSAIYLGRLLGQGIRGVRTY